MIYYTINGLSKANFVFIRFKFYERKCNGEKY